MEDGKGGVGEGDTAILQAVARAGLSGVETFNPKQVTETTSVWLKGTG